MKIVIIGAGLGGLECGFLLSKQGHEICVLEKNPQVGGCLQTFRRRGQLFDTGVHYVGGLGEGEILHRLFEPFGLNQLPWQPLDRNGFDEVIYQGESFSFANGYKEFAEKITSYFPHQKEEIAQYAKLLQKSQEGLLGSFSQDAQGYSEPPELLSRSAYQYLQTAFTDDKLRNVLSGTSLKMELHQQLPLYIFAQTNGTFIQSAWRLKGGGSQIAEHLAAGIRSHGGEVRTSSPASGFTVHDGRITGVTVSNGDVIPCDTVISDIHPNLLMAMLPEGLVRRTYRSRICALPNSAGMFTAHLLLKPDAVAYRNHNLFVHNHTDLWDGDNCCRSVGAHFAVPEEGGYARNIDLFTPMAWAEVAQWAQGRCGRRGDDYEAFKLRTAEKLIRMVEPYLPDLKGNIENIYTSTPLTYRDYTGTHEGSAYGIIKDCEHVMTTFLPPRTSVPNLFLTGQNVNFHGILGVTITATQLAGQLTGMEK